VSWCYVNSATLCSTAMPSMSPNEDRYWRVCKDPATTILPKYCQCKLKWHYAPALTLGNKTGTFLGCSNTPDKPDQNWCFVENDQCNDPTVQVKPASEHWDTTIQNNGNSDQAWKLCNPPKCKCMDVWNDPAGDESYGCSGSGWCPVYGGDGCLIAQPPKPGMTQHWINCTSPTSPDFEADGGACGCLDKWQWPPMGVDGPPAGNASSNSSSANASSNSSSANASSNSSSANASSVPEGGRRDNHCVDAVSSCQYLTSQCTTNPQIAKDCPVTCNTCPAAGGNSSGSFIGQCLDSWDLMPEATPAGIKAPCVVKRKCEATYVVPKAAAGAASGWASGSGSNGKKWCYVRDGYRCKHALGSINVHNEEKWIMDCHVYPSKPCSCRSQWVPTSAVDNTTVMSGCSVVPGAKVTGAAADAAAGTVRPWCYVYGSKKQCPGALHTI